MISSSMQLSRWWTRQRQRQQQQQPGKQQTLLSSRPPPPSPPLFLLLLILLLLTCSSGLAHSITNRQLLRVEPLTDVQLDIAQRPDVFFQKRGQTPNPGYMPRHPHAIQHDDMLRLTLHAYNRTFHLHLEPNLDFFHTDAVTWHQGQAMPLRHDDFRIYRGHCVSAEHSQQNWAATLVNRNPLHVNSMPSHGWARVTLRPDLVSPGTNQPVFEGSFVADGDLYHIKTMTNFKRVKRADDANVTNADNTHMVIYRDSDTMPAQDQHATVIGGTCGFDHLQPNLATLHRGVYDPWFDVHRGFIRRQSDSGCPATRKVAYMGVAADCTYSRAYGSLENVRLQIITDWNTASAVYESAFNIQLGLINITVMSELCPSSYDKYLAWNQACSSSYNITDRLSDFSRWRGLMSEDGAALWHLMTSCASGSEVGVAWLQQLCHTDASKAGGQYVSGTGVSSIIRDEWKVVAHEIGHGFGAIHDCTSSNCPCARPCSCCPLSNTQCDAGGTYLMNPINNVSSEQFSPCTVKTVCDLYPTLGTCLEDPGQRTVQTIAMCGNGIREGDEECDPGEMPSACCDPATCKYINGARCDDATDPCCNQCQIRPNTYQCRPSGGKCDIPEYCNGTSAACPVDVHVADGTACGNGMQCASGICTSRDQQCRDRGGELGITKACASRTDTCQLTCQSPSSSTCTAFTGNFRDGTPCGSGVCRNGECDKGSIGDRALAWLQQNKAIAIPVGVVLALLLLCAIAYCFFRGCCGWRGYRAYQKQHRKQTSMDPLRQPDSPSQRPLPPTPSPPPHEVTAKTAAKVTAHMTTNEYRAHPSRDTNSGKQPNPPAYHAVTTSERAPRPAMRNGTLSRLDRGVLPSRLDLPVPAPSPRGATLEQHYQSSPTHRSPSGRHFNMSPTVTMPSPPPSHSSNTPVDRLVVRPAPALSPNHHRMSASLHPSQTPPQSSFLG